MMKIDAMKLEDIPEIARLEKLCFSAPWSEDSLRSELSNPLSLWLTARQGDTLCGYIGSQTVLGESDMMNLAVAPEFRRRGVGEALVNALIDTLGVSSTMLTLEVRMSNQPARRLYEKLGFTQVGVRPGYYEKPKEDACILRKVWSI